MKSKNRLTALLLGGAMVLSLLAGCAGTPVNDGAPAAAPNGPQIGRASCRARVYELV